MFQSIEYKHPKFYQVFRIFIVILASIIFAWNLCCFARPAGLFPGGFSGFSAGDLPEIPAHSCSIYTAECPVKYHPGLHRVQIHRTEIHTLLDSHDHPVEYFRRHPACLCIYAGRHAEQCVRRSDQRIRHQPVLKCWHNNRRYRLHQHLSVPAQRN